jgi:hypothetical protein
MANVFPMEIVEKEEKDAGKRGRIFIYGDER